MNRLIISLILTLSIAAGLQAQYDIEIERSPERPTDRDELIMTISGVLPHTGFDLVETEYFMDNNILFSMWHLVEGLGLQMLTPWEVVHNWGRLEAGRYQIAAVVYNRLEDDEEEEIIFSEVSNFSVIEGEPYVIEVELAEGWNLVSSYIDPDEPDIRTLFTPLIDEGILRLVKDASGRFYWPEYDYNNIPEWNVTEGYYVNVSEDTELTFEGSGIAYNHPIPLRWGWNIAAYFPEDDVEADRAFYNIRRILIIAKDDEGHFYHPERRFNNMDALTRGRGYMVKLAENRELIWNVPD